MPDGYLPPIIAEIRGNASPLIRELTEARAELLDFARESATATLKLNTAPAFAEFQAMDKAMSAEGVSVPLRVNIRDALAAIAMVRAAGGGGKSLAAGGLGSLFGNGVRGALGGAVWGNTGGGFLGRLLSPLTMLTTMFSAGFGSLGSFAGFGPEHLAMVGAGLAGSAAEGAAGGGLLALGSLGKTAVGGGADALATHTTMTNVKTLYQAQNALNTAIAVYGANSRQAAVASARLRDDMKQITPAARSAELAVAQAASTLKDNWDTASAGAQVQSTQIMQQVLGLASSYTGRVASAAQANLSIINTGLKPLFAWLEGPQGVGIFNQLETEFRSELPTAVHAFDQGVQLLIKTIGIASADTGGFMKHLDAFLTKTNSPTGLGNWDAEIQKLVGDFHMWMALIKTAGHDLHSLFKNDAGTPAAIVEGLTGALKKLGAWEDSAAGKASIFSVFAAHKQEILELASDIGMLGKSFGRVYLTAAPALVRAVTTILRTINPLLTTLARNPFGAWMLGLGLIAARFGAFNPVLKAAGKALGELEVKAVKAAGKWIANMVRATVIYVAQNAIRIASATAAFVAENAATLGIIAGITALIAAVVLVATHWHQVWTDIKNWSKDAAQFIDKLFHDGIIGTLLSIAFPLVGLLTHWKEVWGTIKTVSSDAARFVNTYLVQPIVNFFTQTIPNAGRAVLDWFTSLPGKIVGAFGDAGSMLLDVGKNIIEGLIHGIESMAGKVGDAVKNVASGIKNVAKKILGIFSPSSVMAKEVGIPIAQGIALGITQGMPGVHASLSGLSTLARNVSLSGMPSGRHPQMDRVEKLLTKLVALEEKALGEAKAASNNTKAAADHLGRLQVTSPSEVAARIAANNSLLIAGLRSGGVR